MKTTHKPAPHPRRVRTFFALGALAIAVTACGGGGGGGGGDPAPKPKFTRLCASGAEAFNDRCAATVALPDNAPACTIDNLTGLVWEARKLLNDLSPIEPVRLCGLDNWRAPTVHELMTLDHAGNGDAASIDRDFFPDLVGGDPILASGDTYLSTSTRWLVNFNGSMFASREGQRVTKVRWVRGSSLPAAVNNVYDPVLTGVFNATGSPFVRQDPAVVRRGSLTWLVLKAGAVKSLTEANAELLAVNQFNKTDSSWRLPTRLELDTLVNRDERVGQLTHLDPGWIRDNRYWSSSPVTPNLTWGVDFQFGDITPIENSIQAFVIYVRR